MMSDRREKFKILETPLKTGFLNKGQGSVTLCTSAFFTGKSERADILDLDVPNYGLSFQNIKSKI